MKLTPKAERIREPVKQLLSLLDLAFESNDLDPATWSGQGPLHINVEFDEPLIDE